MRPRRSLTLLAAVAALAVLIAGCGNDVPSGAVAKVDETVIKKEEFDHWLNVAAVGQQSQLPGGGAVVVPDPPDFEECIAAKKEQPAPPGSPKPTDDQLKEQCEQEYNGLRQQAMQFLISAEWIQQEADDRGIEVTDDEVAKQFEDQKNQTFPKEKDYQEFLKTSGQTEEDLRLRIKLQILSDKLRNEVVEGADEVTDDDIAEYYEENKDRFAQPERRDLNVVLTKTEERANTARQALESGQSFKTVAKEFSIDQASKSQGGKLPAVAEGQQEKAFDDAIFSAERGELTGPVKTQFGWYVFEVTKVTQASQQSLDEAKETIRSLLTSQREQEELNTFIEQFQNKYRDETECADDYVGTGDFVVEECGNASDEATTGPASGGTPQVAPPQGGVPPGAPPPGVPQGVPPPTGAPPPQGAPPQGQPVPVPPQG